MPTRLQVLTARRRALVARSEALRGDLLTSAGRLQRSLGLGQLGASALGALRRHPALAVGIGVAVWAAGPRRLMRAAALGLGLWSLYGRARRIAAVVAGLTRPR
jgi:hypothetical protein